MLPTKLQSGEHFKTATVRKVNEIIDYLKSQRIIGDGKTITVNQLTSGIAISVPNTTSGAKGKSTPFNHRFKLNIVQDEESEGVFYLSISERKNPSQ